MSSLELTIKKRNNRVLVEMNADRFERLAAEFGFFGKEFLKSLERAEKGCEGRSNQKGPVAQTIETGLTSWKFC